MSANHRLLQHADASATWLYSIFAPNTASDSLTVAEWALLPNSRLKALLNKTYATVLDFATAFTREGGNVGGAVLDSSKSFTWALDGAGYPVLWHYCNQYISEQHVLIRVCLSHSITD